MPRPYNTKHRPVGALLPPGGRAKGGRLFDSANGLGAVDELHAAVHCGVQAGIGLVVAGDTGQRAGALQQRLHIAVHGVDELLEALLIELLQTVGQPVSYTHLDVYKRQALLMQGSAFL